LATVHNLHVRRSVLAEAAGRRFRALLRWLAAAPRRPEPYFLTLLIIGETLFVSWLLQVFFSTARLSVVFLASVVVVAMRVGSHAAVLAAVLAALAYNVFLQDPPFSFHNLSTADLVNTVVFLGVAVGLGAMAGEVRDEGRRSATREQTARLLFEASREMAETSDEAVLRQRLADWASRATDSEVFVLVANGELFRSEGALNEPPARVLGAVARALDEGGARDLLQDGPWRAQIAGEDGRLGAVIWRSKARGEAALGPDDRLLEVLIDLGAASISRARLASMTAEAESARREQQFINALLSSVSHDFRTPITSILASASSLKDDGPMFDEATREDLLATIEEDAGRLNDFVSNLLNFTRLEAGAVRPVLRPVPVADILRRVRGRLGPGAQARVVIDPGQAIALADRTLLEQALVNVVDNALKYTPEDKAVDVRAEAADGRVRIEVADRGPGADPEHLPRLFQRFYRGPSAARGGGSGLGLFITKGFIDAMGGRIEARQRTDGDGGLVIQVVLPEADSAQGADRP
jgi:K+-sensing histidine kinase KdpD